MPARWHRLCGVGAAVSVQLPCCYSCQPRRRRTCAAHPPNPLPRLGASQVDAAWDAAVAALKGALEPAFRGATAAPAMLTVKDFLLLACLALGALLSLAWRGGRAEAFLCHPDAAASPASLLRPTRVGVPTVHTSHASLPPADHCGYHTAAVREMLLAARPKYAQLLGSATAAAVQVGGAPGCLPGCTGRGGPAAASCCTWACPPRAPAPLR